MRSILRHPVRLTCRGLGMVLVFVVAILKRPRSRTTAGGPDTLSGRARWLTRQSRRLLRTLRVSVSWKGPLPDSGLVVSNHLGYLDILTLAAVIPATFVAKSDVRRWPVIGTCATMAGTLWVDRNRRSATGQAVDAVRQALAQGGLVVLFPEGTSSDGRQVLPFKPALLEPACRATQVWVVHIQYALADGSPGDEIAYWGEATLVPHLLNLLTKREIRAEIRCERAPVTTANRKQLARELHARVCRLGTTEPAPGG